MVESIGDLRIKIMRELIKCSYCGFCEWVCPVLSAMKRRDYGPRGRVNAMLFHLRDGLMGESLKESIYTCLGCGSCSTQCIAGIKPEELIRSFKHYMYLSSTGKSVT
ncbi:(Fe-S)-binding protein [Candidatus Methanodesulfokora washburnensis]|jgi:glycolate oxidase iron-sulfur subunit|nr:(Fe-S)-binding protein [Candidatus Methanodesulfokores washburnensis]